MRIGSKFGSAWLAALLLLFGVVTPTVCVLWFMNQAARTQTDSARQSVTNAYRGQLWLMRDRIDQYWAGRSAALQRISGGSAADFLLAVKQNLADAVILLNANGSVAYPSPAAIPVGSPFSGPPDWVAAQVHESAAAYAHIADTTTDPSLAARAAQAEIRCLAQSGAKEAAIQEIRKRFSGKSARSLLAADEQLLALRLMTRSDRRYLQAAQSLTAIVNDYSVPMPSAHRLFLMDELRAQSAPSIPIFPSYQAERLAAEFLDKDKPSPADRTLQTTRMPGIWKFASPDGRVIALYRNESLLTAMQGLLDQTGERRSVKFAAVPPGAAADSAETVPAGPALPGWRIAFSLLDNKPFDDVARSRMVSYLWAGFLVVGAMIGTGILAGQSLRRQARLARLKTDLLAAVSHELRTPLASMQLLVEALLDENKFEPQKTREYLELMADENRRLSRLIGNFLTFSRIERNRQKFEFHQTNPGDVVQAAIHAMGERLKAPGCELEIEVAEGLPELRADRDALVTVLLNLLDNAYKYTPRDRRILIQVYREGNNVVFAVKDNGIGIAPREQKRIFRRFYQVDRRLAREAGGCGLGLSIVEFIVRAHGGEVRVESQPGSGSTFRVLAPFAREASA